MSDYPARDEIEAKVQQVHAILGDPDMQETPDKLLSKEWSLLDMIELNKVLGALETLWDIAEFYEMDVSEYSDYLDFMPD